MTKAIHFLLVEDNDDHAELIRQCVAQHDVGIQLDRVGSGEEALTYLKHEGAYSGSVTPSVVLLDINLPGMDGVAVLDAIKRDPDLKRIPVVMLTTSKAARDRTRAYESHANSYVTKPVQYHQLLEVVENIQVYWATCNQPPA